MQSIIKLFNKTLSRVPTLQPGLPKITSCEKVCPASSVYSLDMHANFFYMLKLIYTQVSQLQKEIPRQVVDRFYRQYQSVQFQYQQGQFLLKKRYNQLDIQYRIGAVCIQEFDHPFFRQTLYFHQMKDADKYITMSIPKNFPKNINDVQRKFLVDQTLDQKNPLGVPTWAKPLNLQISVSNCQQQDKKHRFSLVSKLGKTMLKKCEWQNSKTSQCHQQNPYTTNAYLFDNRLQSTIFSFLKQKANINQYEIAQMNKLAFVGGCVMRIQTMMDVVEEVGKGIQQQMGILFKQQQLQYKEKEQQKGKGNINIEGVNHIV